MSSMSNQFIASTTTNTPVSSGELKKMSPPSKEKDEEGGGGNLDVTASKEVGKQHPHEQQYGYQSRKEGKSLFTAKKISNNDRAGRNNNTRGSKSVAKHTGDGASQQLSSLKESSNESSINTKDDNKDNNAQDV